MKSKIKQITLLDGKQLFYPSEEEVKKLNEQIESIIVEETMTKEEYLNWEHWNKTTNRIVAEAIVGGMSITRIEPKEYYRDSWDNGAD